MFINIKKYYQNNYIKIMTHIEKTILKKIYFQKCINIKKILLKQLY